jgi:hypothetical protein
MPNWCSNELTLEHDDPTMIDIAVKGFEEGKLLHTFVPVPEELLDDRTGSFGGEDADEKDALRRSLKEKYGYESWYDWRLAHWGTKWDVGGTDGYVERKSENKAAFSFDSAWSPPVDAYAALEELGFRVTAYYFEPGVGFAGRWQGGDDCYDCGSSEDARDLPDDIEKAFGLVATYEEWESEEDAA